MTTPTPSHVLPAPNVPDPWQKRLLPVAKWIGLLLLFYLLGPVIMLATDTREDAARQVWQAEERWAHVTGSAILALLCYVPIVLFHGPFATLWATSFVTLAQWLHVPFLSWFADTTILPPVPSGTLLRWLLAYPLSGLFAILLEVVQPRTVWETKRVLTHEEQQQVKALAQAQQQRKAAQQGSTATNHTTAVMRKPRKPRVSTGLTPEQRAPLPPSDSLWGQIDWNTVLETHPLKGAVREEMARRAAQPQEEKRQLVARTHQPSSPQIIDATPAHPTTRDDSPSDTDMPDYNWDEDEGRIHA